MKQNEMTAVEGLYGANNYHPLDIVLIRGEGVWVWDVNGNRYLDCLAAYSAVNQGHCHPRILAEFVRQAQTLTLTSRAFRNDQLPRLYEMLHRLTGYDKVLPMNSGAEAVETAIKAARKWAYTVKGVPQDKAEIIVAGGNFHGRTTTIVGFSSEEQYKSGFGPFAPGFRTVRYGDIDDLRKNINSNTAAFLVEAIQGEAGIIVPPEGYLKAVEEVCNENNVLLILDEIQSGLGRCGTMFAYEYENIQPDAVIIGKALSGGFYPVSAVLARDEVLDVFHPGDHGSTFGGNPLAAATACAALEVLMDEHLFERANIMGAYFMKGLKEIRSGHIREIRGKGLWIGLELDTNARPYCEVLARLGILCKETHDRVLRIAPPLVISKAEIDWALERFQEVLTGFEPRTTTQTEKELSWQED